MLKLYKKPFLPLITLLGKLKAKRFKGTPILVGGCARSGTTLLLSIISAHKEIFAFDQELGLFNEVEPDEHGVQQPTRMDRLYRHLLIRKVKDTATRWVEKTPANVRRIDVIENYYKGNFRFIHLVRDGRDVILSKHPKDKQSYWVPPERWIEDVSMGLAYVDHPKVFTVKYEDLVTDFENTIAKLFEFLNLPVSEEVLNWFTHASVKKNVAFDSRRVQELHGSSVGKWRSAKNRARAEELMKYPEAVKLLDQFGYL